MSPTTNKAIGSSSGSKIVLWLDDEISFCSAFLVLRRRVVGLSRSCLFFVCFATRSESCDIFRRCSWSYYCVWFYDLRWLL